MSTPETDPDTDGFDEPDPSLDNDESENQELKDRYGSPTDTSS